MKNIFISIKIKMVVTFVLCMLIIVPIGFTIMNNQIMTSYTEIEKTAVEEQLELVLNIINNLIDNSHAMVVDWAAWDDSYKFIVDGNETYILGNLQDESLINLDLNLILFLNTEGKVVYEKFIDLEGSESYTLSDEFLSTMVDIGITKNSDPTYQLSGFVDTNYGPMLIVSHPILTSDEEGPVTGNLIFGRLVDDYFIGLLSKTLGREIILSDVADVSVTEGFVMGENFLEGGLLTSDTLVEEVSEDEIKGSKIFYTLSGGKLMKMSVAMSRDTLQLGRESVRIMVFLLTLSFLFLAVVILVTLYKIGLSRILDIYKEVMVISRNKDISARISQGHSKDEIYSLTYEINELLTSNEALYKEVESNKNDLEVLVHQRTKELVISNDKLKDEAIEREKIQKKVKNLAYHDHLTGLANRLLFTDRLEQAILQASRTETLLAVVFIDVDSFKVVNDTLGHSQGDELLKKIAKRLSSRLRKNDTICRIGGDEFVIMLKGYNNYHELKKITKKILGCYDEPFDLEAQEFSVTCSMGVAQYPIDGENVEILIKNADIAMYEAKDHGKNQCVICSEDLKENILETLSITNHLYHSIERNEMEVYYQPQYNIDADEIIGLEALLRWQHPDLGYVGPSKFIPIAEKTRLIIPIGEWVLRQACEQNSQWEQLGIGPIPIAVNFSLYQLYSPTIIETIKQVLSDTKIDPKYLEIEITESIAMDKTGVVNEILVKLKELGVSISIDDFGTEYSSLSRLKELPIDRVKIDLSFVQGINVNKKDEAIIKAIILLAENLGLETVAEGVETMEQLEFLQVLKCTYIQGYLLAKPLNANDVQEVMIELLKKHKKSKEN